MKTRNGKEAFGCQGGVDGGQRMKADANYVGTSEVDSSLRYYTFQWPWPPGADAARRASASSVMLNASPASSSSSPTR